MPSQTCSHTLKPGPCSFLVISPRAVSHRLPCHVTSALHVPMQGGCQPQGAPETQWLCGMGALGHSLKPRGGTAGTQEERGECPWGTGRPSSMAEQGLLHHLRGPWHRRDMQVQACWPPPYKAPASSADTREMPGGIGGLGWPELLSPSKSNLQHHTTPHPLSRNPTSPGQATSSRNQMSANSAARGALRAA